MSQTPPNQNESIAMIVDTSSSATSCWDETRRAAQRIYWLLTGSEPLKLYTLGNPIPISPKTLEQARSPGFSQRAQACSLIAPMMETLVRQEQKHSLIVVGSGEVFDLDDWIDDPHVDGWLLVRTGEQSLQGKQGRLPEITPDQIRNVETLLSYFSSVTREPDNSSRRGDYHGSYQWEVDASGYPLIQVEPLGSFVHLFPVTRPQFEKFMASGKQQGFGDEWYSENLKMSPRASYRSTDSPAREQLFMTGVTTDEAASFSRWLGREYTLLSAKEWRECYECFAKHSAISAPEDLNNRLSRDAQAIWEIIEDQCRYQNQRPTLQELSLMTQGILEWVIERPGKYCGLGEPASSQYLRKACDPVHPLGPVPYRLKDLGFRLCTKKR